MRELKDIAPNVEILVDGVWKKALVCQIERLDVFRLLDEEGNIKTDKHGAQVYSHIQDDDRSAYPVLDVGNVLIEVFGLEAWEVAEEGDRPYSGQSLRCTDGHGNVDTFSLRCSVVISKLGILPKLPKHFYY